MERSRSSRLVTSGIVDTDANKERSPSPGSSTDGEQSEQAVHPLGTPISMARLPVPEKKQPSSSSTSNQPDAAVEEITVSDMEEDNDTQHVPVHDDDTPSIPASQQDVTPSNDVSIKKEDSTAMDTLMDDEDGGPEVTKSLLNTTSDNIWGPRTNDDLPQGMKVTRELFNEYSIDESSVMHDQLFELLIKATDLDDTIHQQADAIIQKYRQHDEDHDKISKDGGASDSDHDMKDIDHEGDPSNQ